jgi:hypothetical protein
MGDYRQRRRFWSCRGTIRSYSSRHKNALRRDNKEFYCEGLRNWGYWFYYKSMDMNEWKEKTKTPKQRILPC